ncbi:TPA: hypothetical protein PXP20_002117 [Yersinia enterocolitica]|nr:hypothetical protein [Yersinia enterocolitica]
MATANQIEQALIAILHEVKEEGIDISALIEKTTFGIMQNKPYVWVNSPKDKVNACEALKIALKKLG